MSTQPTLSLLLCLILLTACQRSASVSGVWREIEEIENSSPSSLPPSPTLYELSLGQYGDRVTGVSVRYQRPSEESLALFDPADRCNCSFVVQGLIEERIPIHGDRELLFIANGLTFSLYTPQESEMLSSSPTPESNQSCPELVPECKRIFNLDQVDGGDRLSGFTWCLEAPDETRRPILFEAINGLVEDSCEVE